MAYLLLILQLLLALVLLAAATSKILSTEQFSSALRFSDMPKVLVIPITILIPTLELCLVTGLLLSPSHMLPFVMSICICLFSAFTVWMVTVYVRGLRVKCGCFGTGGSDIGLGTILRNILLIVASLGGFVLALYKQSPLSLSSIWMAITVFSCCMSFMLLLVFQQSRTALVLSRTQLQNAQTRFVTSSDLSIEERGGIQHV